MGTTFDILSTAFGLSGTFDLVDYQNLPADNTLYVSYLANAVRLTVVNKPSYAADFDDDGDVDATDYIVWRHAFKLNQLGDVTENRNDSWLGDWLMGVGAGKGRSNHVDLRY